MADLPPPQSHPEPAEKPRYRPSPSGDLPGPALWSPGSLAASWDDPAAPREPDLLEFPVQPTAELSRVAREAAWQLPEVGPGYSRVAVGGLPCMPALPPRLGLALPREAPLLRNFKSR
ncbi:unnamed protein product [Calypogeia fissa]